MKFWDLLFCDCCYIGICLRILHVCGGAPMQSGVHVMITGCAPRMWRLKQQSFCTIDYL